MKQAKERGVSESSLAHLAREVPAKGPLWLRRLRKSALERFRDLGFPTSRDEEWKQTSVAPISEAEFVHGTPDPRSVSPADFRSLPLADLGYPRLVLVNGIYAEHLSELDDLPPEVRVESMARALLSRPEVLEPHLGRLAAFEDQSFVALNSGCIEDGILVTLPPKLDLEVPIHLIYLTEANGKIVATHPRTLVTVGDHTRASLVETYLGRDGQVYLTNAVTEVVLGENATLDHSRVQWESDGAFHMGTSRSLQARHSRYVNHNISFGATLARHEIGSIMNGEGSETDLNGLYLARGTQHVDNHTVLDHAKPHCPSHELYKGILAESARAVFHGQIIVREGAQKTDAKQSNKNLLLSDDALVHTRPQLEIYADDVKCTHGATIGQLDKEALFYLRTRGVALRDARALLVRGFAGEVLGRIGSGPLRERLEQKTSTVMSRALASGEGP